MSIKFLEDLDKNLQEVLNAMQIDTHTFGNPQSVIKATNEVKKTFEGFASASAPKDRAYSAAINFLRGQLLTEDEYAFISAEINTPVKEQGGKKIIESERFPVLLDYYKNQILKNDMLRLTWYWLFLSYFGLKSDNSDDSVLKENISSLRTFLSKTYTHFTQNKIFSPEWVNVLNEHTNLLTLRPCDRYAEAYLQGKPDEVMQIKNSLSIPNTSWFWHRLTLSVVCHAASIKHDHIFKDQIPKLVVFLDQHQGYRDEAIKIILNRYHQCIDKTSNKILCDYIIRVDVWKNPKLRNLGIASKWHSVDDKIWRMVFGWVTRENLRMFFEIISGRNGARKDRFSFWSQYIEQITFTKLVFGDETNWQRNKNPEIKKLFSEEEGVYALLDSNNKTLDAFIMQIGDYTFVEFSMNGNAAFIYKNDRLPFNLNDRRMNDRTYKNGLKSAQDNKIIHNNDWQFATKNCLIELGIFPDIQQSRW